MGWLSLPILMVFEGLFCLFLQWKRGTECLAYVHSGRIASLLDIFHHLNYIWVHTRSLPTPNNQSINWRLHPGLFNFNTIQHICNKTVKFYSSKEEQENFFSQTTFSHRQLFLTRIHFSHEIAFSHLIKFSRRMTFPSFPEARATSVKSLVGIITRQSHISQVGLPWVTHSLSDSLHL